MKIIKIIEFSKKFIQSILNNTEKIKKIKIEDNNPISIQGNKNINSVNGSGNIGLNNSSNNNILYN